MNYNFYKITHIDSLLPALIASAVVFFFLSYLDARDKRDKIQAYKAQKPSHAVSNRVVSPSASLSFGASVSRFFKWLVALSAERVELFGAPYGLFVFFAVAHLCFVPFIFNSSSGIITPNYVVYLRVVATLSSFLLIMKDFWPRKLIGYLPLYWHLTLFICLPYFAFSMCLFTSFSIEWLIDLLLTIFILGVLVDWKSYISMIFAGLSLGLLTFMAVGDVSNFDPNYGNLPIAIYSIAVSLGVGVLFSRNKERVLLEKISAFRALGGTIAHEMRTPLSSIYVSASGLKDSLPALVSGYSQAKAAGIAVPRISPLALSSMADVPERMGYICASTLNIIDMLLLQLKDNDWDSHFSECSIKNCVETATKGYCFRENEVDLIDIKNVHDFNFLGNQHLVVHILFNLMRNAFTFIQSEKNGSIEMWTSQAYLQNRLHFCDTAKGINKKDLPHIFEAGFSKRMGGSGVGLYYCKKMMNAMSGTIVVKSVEGEYCEFVLSFPSIKN